MRAPSELSVKGSDKWEGSGRTPTFDRDQRFGDYTLGEHGFLWRKKTGQVRREERVQVAGTGVSSVTGRSGERIWVGGMFTND